jgi:hypothetical protein
MVLGHINTKMVKFNLVSLVLVVPGGQVEIYSGTLKTLEKLKVAKVVLVIVMVTIILPMMMTKEMVGFMVQALVV